MQSSRNFIVAAFLLCVLACSNALAQQSYEISYQGLLRNADGRIVSDGEYRITATLYADNIGSEVVWADKYLTTVRSGQLHLFLGSGLAPLPQSRDLDKPLWLGIAIEGSEELRPLTAITATPLALNVADRAITTQKIANGAVTKEKLDREYVSSVTVDGQRIDGGDLNLIGKDGISIAYDKASKSILVRNGESSGSHDGKSDRVQAVKWDLSGNAIAAGDILGTTNNFPLVIHTNGGERMRVTAGGDVGIGTTTPTRRLDVIGTIGATGAATFGSTINTQLPLGVVRSAGASTNLFTGPVNLTTEVAGILPIANGGTSASTAAAAANNLLPSQSGNAGEFLQTDGSGNLAWALPIAPPSNFWSLTGNVGTTAGVNFIGTTDDEPLEIRVYTSGGTAEGYSRVMRYEPQLTSPNIIGGHNANAVTSGARGGTIAGGGTGSFPNTVTDHDGTVGGGRDNRAGDLTAFDAYAATVAGGLTNIAASRQATIGGGGLNTVNAVNGTISGGLSNTITTGSDYSAIGGGFQNQTTGPFAFIGSGTTNNAANNSVVGGGVSNTATSYGFIGGGSSNQATGTYATIGGGGVNVASGNRAAILAGELNAATGAYSSIGGGLFNTVSHYSAIPGGNRLKLGSYSFGFNGTTQIGAASTTTTDLSANVGIGYFGNIDLWVGNVDGTARSLRFYSPNSSLNYTGAKYSAFHARPQVASIDYILPASLGSPASVLVDMPGTGDLTWAPISAIAGGNFIQNQNSMYQPADWKISGTGEVAGDLIAGMNVSAGGHADVGTVYKIRTNTVLDVDEIMGKTTLGVNAVTSSPQATALGHQATAGGFNSTAIGANSQALQSNSVVLGNQADVGIWTTQPQSELHIDGNGTITLRSRTNDPAPPTNVGPGGETYKLYILDGPQRILRVMNTQGVTTDVAIVQ